MRTIDIETGLTTATRSNGNGAFKCTLLDTNDFHSLLLSGHSEDTYSGTIIPVTVCLPKAMFSN